MKGILFLSASNSARSQMAEGLARALSRGRLYVQSAGMHPVAVHPFAVEVMREIGVDISAQESKSVATVEAAAMDTIITLGAEEVCPTFPGEARRLRWPVPDPCAMCQAASREALLENFRLVRDALQDRIARFLDDERCLRD